MPRRYNIYDNSYYHIVHHAVATDKLFYTDSDKVYFIKLLKDMKSKFGTKICAFALMDNHVHLMIRIIDYELSEPLKFLFQSYAQYFNVKHKRKGSLFNSRFFSEPIRDELYLLACSLYIHLNPYKARMCDRPLGYRWTSLVPFVTSVKKTFLNFQDILKVIDSKDRNRAKRVYNELVDNNKKYRLNHDIEDINDLEKFFRSFCLEQRRSNKFLDEKYSYQIENFYKLEEKIELLSNAKTLKNSKSVFNEVFNDLVDRGYRPAEIAQLIKKSKKTVYQTVRMIKNAGSTKRCT